MHVSSDKGKDVEDDEVLKRYPFLQQFQDVFLAEMSYLLPHREVDFSMVGTRSSTSIKGTSHDEHSRIGGIKVAA